MRRLTYFIASTIDGFIAGPSGEIDFYPVTEELLAFLGAQYPETLPTHGRAALGINSANRRFDTVIMGRATYDPALQEGITSPYAHLRQYVVSTSIRDSPDPKVKIVSGDPVTKVRELKAESGGLGIYLAGGSQLAGTLLPEIDEFVVKLYPVVAGAGIPLFSTGFDPTQFELVDTQALRSGVVILTYAKT
jgi:dihydrofolate reductase